MNEYIDHYCERLEPGMWAEPLNVLTNSAFFVAAFAAYFLARREHILCVQTQILLALVVFIGFGSALFHIFATEFSMMADVLPILLFQISFIWFYALRVMKLCAIKTAGLFGIFIALTILAQSAPAYILNGSLSYAPAILFLFAFGIWHQYTKQRERFVLLAASIVFLLSLAFRSLDMAVCDRFEMGTHFLWHILNGCVLYLTVRGFIFGQKGKPKDVDTSAKHEGSPV